MAPAGLSSVPGVRQSSSALSTAKPSKSWPLDCHHATTGLARVWGRAWACAGGWACAWV